MSHFEQARGLLRASLLDNFGSDHTVTLSDGYSHTVRGYVKSTETDGVKTHHFYASEDIEPGSRVMVNGQSYSLAFAGMADGKGGQSQVVRMYVMSLPVRNQGASNGWSEFENVG